MAVGVVLAIFMDVRYLWIYYDFSEALLWTSIGLLIIGISWLYGKTLDLRNTLDSIEEYLADKR